MAKKQELQLVTQELAARKLGVSTRRIREMALEGKLPRHRAVDPATRREVYMFAAQDVDRLGGTLAEVPPNRFLLPASPAPSDTLWLSVSEAAAYSGIAEKTLLRLIREGKLPAIDQHVRGDKWRIRRKTLEEFDGSSPAKR